jgi:hypothetical protein
MKKAMMQATKFDNLYTPDKAVIPLLPYLPPLAYEDSESNYTIWECADAGNSKITKILKNEGYPVISTDIETGFDFLNDVPNFHFDIIISNPPFSLKDKWIKKCYEYNKPFALLLPLTALEGIQRGKMYREHGISVIVLDKRIDFTGKGANWFNASWFVWNIIRNNCLTFESL